MRSVIHQALNAYSQVAVDANVMTAHPHRLIVLLFESARLAIATARHHMGRQEISQKGAAVSKAINIIDNGLQASLDLKAGGELAERLHALYGYMSNRLLLSNLKNDDNGLAEVARLLSELQEAWEAIAPPQAQAGTPPRTVSAAG